MQLAAAYALKLGARRETYDTQPQKRSKDLFAAGLATFYTVFLAFAAGSNFLLLSLVIYTPGATFLPVPPPARRSALLRGRAGHPRRRRGRFRRRVVTLATGAITI